MEQSSLQEILHALKLHSNHIDSKLNDLKDELNGDKVEAKFEKHFDRMEKKFDAYQAELRKPEKQSITWQVKAYSTKKIILLTT